MTSSWHFNTKRPSDKERNPIQGEFFATDAISNPGEALVREGIQNSLDARRNHEKVMVRISVSGKDAAVAREMVAPLLNGLDEHLKAPGNGLREIPEDSENCPVLVFEDFGTTGLIGDPAETSPPDGSRNRFFHFFRADGLSDKSEKDRGRWGVGKQVFPRASRINSIFGFTVREDDKRALLMGMAVLKTHDLNGQRYMPDGWLGQHQAGTDGSLVLPIEDADFINAFIKTFDIHRGNEPGFSIVVPWCDLDLTDENLVTAVLRDYFWPIVRGQLEVIVEAPSLPPLILDKEHIEEEVKKIGGDLEREVLPLIELAKWSCDLGDEDFITLMDNGDMEWSSAIFTEDYLPLIRDQYERGDKVAIRIPLSTAEKGAPPSPTHFDVLFFRDGSAQTGKPVFIREGIIIRDVRRRGSGVLRGVHSLVVAEDDPIATFLGDSENPAHTQWQKDGANFKGKYDNAPKTLDFVKHSVIEIVRIISEQDQKEDRTLLSDLFSIPAPPEDQECRTRDKKKPEDTGTGPDEPPPPPPPRPRPFIIDRIEGGFVVRNGDTNGSPPPEALLIRAAYQVRRGNPFKKYHPADFNFSQRMKVQLEGAKALLQKENRLQVKIDNSDFRIEVTGFDPNRDVRVEVRREEGDNAGSNA